MDALRKRMEAIYCPPLDTSLLAAMLADVEEECKVNKLSKPTNQQIVKLQNDLSELSANAVEDSGNSSDPNGRPNGAFSDTPRSAWSSDDTPEWSSGDTTTSSSDISNVNFPQFAFLQAAFPHIEAAKLQDVIIAVGGPDGSADMEDVIERVLNREYQKECRERGIDVDVLLDDGPKNKPRVQYVAPPKKKWTKLVLNDVRQQHHLSSPNSFKGFPPPDPWAQSMSLSTHLATLVPSYNPDHFQSAFHDPQHSSPSKALRYTLQRINDKLYPGNDELSERETQCLFGMFDALRASPFYETMNVEQRDQLLSDARLALRATGGAPDSAWELVSTLLELDRDLDIGICHSPPTTPLSPTFISPTSPTPKSRPSGSQWATSGSTTSSPISPTSRNSDFDRGWTYVPERPRNTPNYLTASIPAYHPNRKARIKGAGSGFGEGRREIGELKPMQRIAQLHKNRNQMLREATRYWKGGNAGNRRGEVAQYYAERARELQIQAKAEELEIVRDMVYGTRETANGCTSIDLHGATIAQASRIVEEIVCNDPPTNAKPLKIITGRGTHSANRVGVLRPALKNRLTELGWDVALFNGGLTVRAKS